MKREIPWGSIVGFLLLVALGIGVPFWLEFRSLTNPPSTLVRTPRLDLRPMIGVRKGYYCGNCADLLVLPEWRGATEREAELLTPLSLNALDRPTWETPRASTRPADAAPELRENP
jgi:hypothetical protein